MCAARNPELGGSISPGAISRKRRQQWLDGSHLFLIGKPLATAAAIEAALLNMASLGRR